MSGNFEDAAGYERTTAAFTRQAARQFVPWLAVRRDARWLDCGCGTGALTSAILDLAWAGEVTGADTSEAFLAEARRAAPGVRFEVADVMRLPFPDGHFDAVVSGAVLHHLGDPAGALREMARVTAPGGTVGAFSWIGLYGLVRPYADATARAGAGVPAAPSGLSSAEEAAALFAGAGLGSVQSTSFEPAVGYASFDEWWAAITGRRWFVSDHFKGLAPDVQDRVRSAARDLLGDAPRVAAPTWAVKARR